MELDRFLNQIQETLPPDWSAELPPPLSAAGGADLILRIEGADGSVARVLVEAKERLSAQKAAEVAGPLLKAVEASGADAAMVFSTFVGAMARRRLRERGIGYMDLTGNTWIRMSRPALFIQSQGADTDPNPPRRGPRSLKGAKSARLVRALCDHREPFGVRELAALAGTDPGYATRVLSFLEQEDLVVRDENGQVVTVRWSDLIRRWSMDYTVMGSNRAVWFLAPRGTAAILEKLANVPWPCALTGSSAVPLEARVAAGGILSCYVHKPETVGAELGLHPTESGANVLLLQPFNRVVFERTRQVAGVPAAALSQCAVDLITGIGREPAEGEALVAWMAENENAWRS